MKKDIQEETKEGKTENMHKFYENQNCYLQFTVLQLFVDGRINGVQSEFNAK